MSTLRATLRADSGVYSIRATYTPERRPSMYDPGEPADIEIESVTDATGAECSDEEIARRESAALGEAVTAQWVSDALASALECS